MRILAADIGGTNSRFAAFDATEAGGLLLRRKVQLPTQDSDSFAELMAKVWPALEADPREFRMSVLAVAGPVRDGVYCKPSNIPWDIDVSGSLTELKLYRCLLINDFVAQVFACRTEAVSQALAVKTGDADPQGALAAVGAGTGLGHCALLPVNGDFLAVPSEAGHAAFPFIGSEEAAYEAYVRQVTGKPYGYGDVVVSGPGLSLLHRFHTGEDLTPEMVSERLAPDTPTQVWFSRFLARACRNYALTVLATGGLYIAGGVAARNPLLVQSSHFTGEFVSSPSHGGLLSRIPVFLNDNEDSGLYGAAYRGVLALRRLEREEAA